MPEQSTEGLPNEQETTHTYLPEQDQPTAMQPVYEIWEQSGSERAYIEACIRSGRGERTAREISQQEYDALSEKYGSVGVFFYVPTELDADGDTVAGEREYYMEETDAPIPHPGTRIHFQTGVVDYQGSPFEAQIYRATFTGEGWAWQVSHSVYAKGLEDRVAQLSDTDYTACERPAGAHLKSSWLITEPEEPSSG